MMRRFFVVLVFFAVVAVGYYLADYLALTRVQDLSPRIEPVIGDERTAVEEVDVKKPSEVAYGMEVFVQNLQVPWSIVFTSPRRILVTERKGRLRVIENGQLLDQPLKVFDEVSSTGEEGLMGMTLDSDYEENRFLYISMAYPKEERLAVKVVRYRDEGDSLSDETVILDDIPAAQFHAGSRIKFGPDGKLYVTTGDATDKELAQDPQSLAGKILRLNADGSVPEDNPFPGSPVYSLGHRNPQGIDWHPLSGAMYSTEHGPSVFDGPAGGDEVNIIKAGGNYGWPRVSHERNEPGLVAPKLVFTPAVAPASGMFYRGEVFPQFRNNFFFGLLRGEGIMRVVVSEDDPEKILSFEKLAGVDVGRVRDVVEGPDGMIYFVTSNTDGRGTVRSGDDTMYRLVPRMEN